VGDIFRTCLDRSWGPPSLLYNGYRDIPRDKEWPERDADPSTILVPWSRKSRAVFLLPLWAVRPVQRISAGTVQLYLNSPYGPYGLYSSSVPVKYSYSSTPPMDSTVCTEPQCLYSTAITLFPFGQYGLYRASVPVQYSYNSTPTMGRTACTEPQCLYSTAILLLSLCAVRPVQSLSACRVQL